MFTKRLKLTTFISIAIISCFSSNIFGQETPNLKFNKKGEFKILQLTDLHLSANTLKAQETVATIQNIIVASNPDFIVVTGDIVTDDPAKEGWKQMASPIIDADVPWTVTFGNHDEEHNLNKEEIVKLLDTFPNFVGENNANSGQLNFNLPIKKANSDQVGAVMYFLDSHDYTRNAKLGSYDWIKNDQIEWYRESSEKYTEANKQKVPSVMFFHIPLPEFHHVDNDPATIGDNLEGVASPEINSGLFSAVIENKDVIGIFTGHDHNNNYIGTYKDVALAFGNVTGADAYGDIERGGRLIVLKENEFAFNTHIIRPSGVYYPYNYPSGLTEINDKTEVVQSIKIKNVDPGLKVDYYEGNFTKTQDLQNKKLKNSSISTAIDLSKATAKDHFGLHFHGYFKAPTTGYYKFATYSDDGSIVKIGGKTVVDNDGSHGAKREEGIIALEAGYHPIDILYIEDYMGEVLEVSVSSIKIPEQALSMPFLYHTKK